jgi:hypothetical protein
LKQTAADDIPLASHYAPEIIERLFENALDEQLKMVERRSEDVVMRVTQQVLVCLKYFCSSKILIVLLFLVAVVESSA